jgi:hypothetical protein
MGYLKHLPLFAFWFMISLSAKAGSVDPRVHFKSYREWKTEKIQEAQAQVTHIKIQIDAKKNPRSAAAGKDPNVNKKNSIEGRDVVVDRLEKQLREEQYDLEVAKDLSVTDYFVGYLTKVTDKKAAFHDVATKLSADEVAELMTAYANSVFGARAADLPQSAANVAKDPLK